MSHVRERLRRRRNRRLLAWVRRTWAPLTLLLAAAVGLGYYAQREMAPPSDAPEAATLEKFHFYEMLKEAEVEVPEGASWEVGGIPMLLAGFFERRDFAEVRRAHLVSLGMEATVQQHASGWRVLLGPFPSRRALQQTRERLQLENIEVQRISVPRARLPAGLHTPPETGTEESGWEAGGIPMLLAGFFERRPFAEVRRAHLASLGMEAAVMQHASGWRVLLGPFPSPRALQQTRERLQLENIEVQRISVPRARLPAGLSTPPQTQGAGWEAGGIPMLLAGFFERRDFAEARRERLAALGMEAAVMQHASGWRVLLGPFRSPRALQQTRERLQLENIEVQRISVPRARLPAGLHTLPETERP